MLLMSLQQLCAVCAELRRNFKASAAADSLHTSQPGVRKQVQLLEAELHVELFCIGKNE